MTEVENQAQLLVILAGCIGKEKAISMRELYQKFYRYPCTDPIAQGRALRKLITDLREQGQPICSSVADGYWLAEGGLELKKYLKRLRGRAMRALVLESKIRKQTLAELLGQLRTEIDG